ncbi:MAG: hypothetical protein JWQ73_1235 [Variovorax sp.]|nr:hypothetical protein [Variovorax sp.]
MINVPARSAELDLLPGLVAFTTRDEQSRRPASTWSRDPAQARRTTR